MGLCSHTVLTLQDAWRHDRHRIQLALIAGRRSRGPKYTRSSNASRAEKWRFKSRRSEGSPIATWRHEESPSPSKVRPHDRDLTATRRPIFFSFRRRSEASDSNPTAEKTGGRTPQLRPDRTAIAARSSRDRRSFRVESLPFDWTA